MPAQRMSTTTSPRAGCGSSTICSTSGARSRSMRMARIAEWYKLPLMMHRRDFLGLTAAGAAAAAFARPLEAAEAAPEFELDEMTIAELRSHSAVALTQAYLARID